MKIFLPLICLLLLPQMALATDTSARPLLSLDRSKAHNVIAKSVRYNGFDGLNVIAKPGLKGPEEGGCDNCTYLELEDINFKNGSIEIEVAGKPLPDSPDWARGFVGVVFRLNGDSSEGIYIRPLNSTSENQLQRNHSVQYFSKPGYPWQVLREQTPGKYEAWADLEVGEWTQLRIDVEGATAILYINGQKEPSLIVNDLKLGSDASGTVGLYSERTSDAYFRNLVITHR